MSFGNPIGSGGNDADGLSADFAGMCAPSGAVAALVQKLLGCFAEFSFAGLYWNRHRFSIGCILLGIKLVLFAEVLISSKKTALSIHVCGIDRHQMPLVLCAPAAEWCEDKLGTDRIA
jgi:hypothetical protein